jgi:hypothetical protein
MIPKLTLEQAIIISGYTGISACPFNKFHEDVERRLGHPVWTHQFADRDMVQKIQEAYRDDFISMCVEK